MEIRDLEQGDFQALEAIHEGSGFDYRFPDLNDPLFIVRKVVDDDGVKQCMALELTASVYVWIDPSYGSPLKRLHALKKLIASARQAAWEKGLNSVYAVIPPEIEEEFGPVMKHLGMTKDRQWPKWSIDLNENL